ncbi:MAG TPA: hypothetical protein VI136_08990 [Verrucomicrobiae bacterium]
MIRTSSQPDAPATECVTSASCSPPTFERIARLVEAVRSPRLARAWQAWWDFKHPGQAIVNDLGVDSAPNVPDPSTVNST